MKIIGYYQKMCQTFWHRFRYATATIYFSHSVNSCNIDNVH